MYLPLLSGTPLQWEFLETCMKLKEIHAFYLTLQCDPEKLKGVEQEIKFKHLESLPSLIRSFIANMAANRITATTSAPSMLISLFHFVVFYFLLVFGIQQKVLRSGSFQSQWILLGPIQVSSATVPSFLCFYPATPLLETSHHQLELFGTWMLLKNALL